MKLFGRGVHSDPLPESALARKAECIISTLWKKAYPRKTVMCNSTTLLRYRLGILKRNAGGF